MFTTLGAQRVYRAALAGLVQRGARDAAGAATDLALRVDDALKARARGDVDQLALSLLNRAALLERFRMQFDRDGQETEKALSVLQGIEDATGAHVPSTPVRERFRQTSVAIWDMETNRYLCKTCGAWRRGDGRHPLAPGPCPQCSEPVEA